MHRVVFADSYRGLTTFSFLALSQTHLSPPWRALQTSLRFASSSSSSSTTPAVNHYKRLGVDTTATVEDLKTAYRCRALQCHPDVVEEKKKAQAEVEFRAVSEAYDVLMDPQRRAEHDKALGVQQPAAQKKTSEKTSSSSSFTRASTTTTTARGTAGTTHKSTRPRRQKTFVRGDADRKFREAFHGMSLDQVIFQERLRQRQAQQEQNNNNNNKTGPSSSAAPSGREEALRRVMADAAARFASKVQRQYGPSMLRHVKVSTSPSFSEQMPSSDYMPFRPFHGFSAPPGVRTPPEPKLGPTSHVKGESYVEFTEPSTRVRRELPKSMPVVRGLDGSVMERSEAERYLEKERNSPYNMGKMYSYHRPY
ncbi:DnaJ chaperone protein [Trypanosoma theileri]|uniref:DnaJ chaperone protein n=1 Tax=Trypanosoma theileri TaxID=67003 RepID=A0A1X0P2B2_9TRYP|nr:DnaJ chaperone protein [Trypanosoma theileri]ORC90968.1 DnaJ chaperone protein [Trypanosoma theileri]